MCFPHAGAGLRRRGKAIGYVCRLHACRTQHTEMSEHVVNDEDEAKTSVINVRVAPRVRALALARAKAESRSLAGYVSWLIERDAEAAKKRKP